MKIFLIGFMGSGKTYWGSRWAAKYELQFIDLDDLVEKSIMSCGGGAPCFNNNMQWMNENGTTIYLSAAPEFLYSRLLEEKDKRPLLKNLAEPELLSFIEQKLKEREPFYKQAKFILPSEDLNMESLQPLNL